MKNNRDEVFSYIFSKADEVGYMGLDSASSGKFQDELENDEELIRIAGKKLSRNYIKDTVLNNYSKKHRYISEEDVLSVFIESEDIQVLGAKKDLENGIFSILYDGGYFESTSSSINEWQTVLKRFGKKVNSHARFSFLTCGGVEKNSDELNSVIDILNSYGISAFIVKPSQAPVSIKPYLKKKVLSPSSLTEFTLSKPFLLLAGISGTGKSRFVREQAEATGSREETYCLVSVRPDWHEPSDLLGYTTRLNNNVGYVTTDVLQFIVKAWKAIAETSVQIAGNKTAGHRDDLQAIPPYWLCLDEMNLAPVEQYFADYLSILETREWEWADDEFTYQCDPLLKASVIQSLSDDKRNELCKNLKLDPTSALWLEFCEHGIGIPFNLLVAGTVNMDETTHGFSRKVIDRALSFDFGDFFPNNFDDYFSPTVALKKLSYPIYSSAAKSKERLPAIDADGKASIQFLHALNTVLDNTPFKLAYRALNELLLSVISHQPEDEIQLQAVWDDFLMCKLLPRIEGDSDKLAQHDIDESLLIKLSRILSTTLHDIWNEPTDLSGARPDFYREKQQGGATIIIACRSRAKIEWMQNKLAQSGFTSFWP
ncbi:hypothetical protein ABRP59_15540 [Pectobacterium punjabense]|uniref:McrB family protein n=1 Tax=Pectobacterium punjabense TaxID=2108399 RepID=UPI0032EFE35F